jgi:hypothetical protein
MLPHEMGVGQDRSRLHPDDLLVHKQSGLLPRGFHERLSLVDMPLVNGRIGHQGHVQRHLKELGKQFTRFAFVVVILMFVPNLWLVAPRLWMIAALVVHQVGRVGRHQCRLLTAHGPRYVFRARTIAHDNAVAARLSVHIIGLVDKGLATMLAGAVRHR